MNKIIDLKLVPFCMVPLANYCLQFGLFHECETVYGILQTRILEWVAMYSFCLDHQDAGIEPKPYIHWWVGSLSLAPPGKPKTVSRFCQYTPCLKQRRKGKIYPFECTLPKNSKER